MKRFTTFKFRNRTTSRNLALGLLMSFGSLLAFAQTVTTTIATGTSTSAYVPIYGNFGYTYSQQIYLASDFAPAVAGQPNSITKIRFYNTSGSLGNSDNWTVFLGQTAQTSFTSNTSWVPYASLTQVFSGILPAPAANSWVEIVLPVPFIWDGISNIVVAVDENTPNWNSSNIYWGIQSTSADRSMQYRNDSSNPDPASPPTASGRYAYIPHAEFVHELAPACSATPTHATAVTSLSTTCANSSTAVDLSRTGSTFAAGLEYQWQYNDGTGWTDYPAGTTMNYSVYPTETINVRLITTCTATAAADTSEEASITVDAPPALTQNYTNVVYCSGTPAQLIAGGADTYTWAPATGLDVTNNDTVLANPANVTNYTVIGTNLAGCKDTVSVIVTPLSKITKTVTATPGTACAPGTPVTVTASASPATIFGGGTYEYRFIAPDGTILQDWSASNTYNFTPASDSLYKVYADFRSSTCTDAIDSISASAIVGFGADVAVVDYDCINTGGTVSLSNIFEPTEAVVYTNPLADPTDLATATFNGSAVITDGRLVITPSATGIGNASAVIPSLGFPMGANNSFTMKFNLTADQPINLYGTGGADGITYSFGDDVTNTGNQNGSGSKLRLVFDAAGNGSNAVGIYLVYGNTGGVGVSSVTPGAGSTVHYVNNTASWKLKTDVPVVFSIDIAGKASLTVDGISIFSNIQMPTTYMTANTDTWSHAFSAATGGDAMRQAVSDWSIATSSVKFAMVPANTTPSAWGDTTVYTGVQPGTYDIWMSDNGSTTCGRKIETIEVVNTNPLVLLGNDTTICEGESLVLDAGNAGATYVWSNSQVTTQTRVVTEAGPYVVNVTAPNGCVGVGSINVDVLGAPTASTIYVENNMPTYTFTILNPQNANQYSWDFGDGTTIANAPGTVTHTYTTAGPRMVSVTLTNECGTETVVATVVVTSTASVSTNTIEGLNVYPNPATDRVIVELPTSSETSGAIFNATGALVKKIDSFATKTEISVSDWTPGVYFLHIQNEESSSIVKLIVE